jgi:hypothetical protein
MIKYIEKLPSDSEELRKMRIIEINKKPLPIK